MRRYYDSKFHYLAGEELDLGTYDRALWEACKTEMKGTDTPARERYLDLRAKQLREAAQAAEPPKGLLGSIGTFFKDLSFVPTEWPRVADRPEPDPALPPFAAGIDITRREIEFSFLSTCERCNRWLQLPVERPRRWPPSCWYCHEPIRYDWE